MTPVTSHEAVLKSVDLEAAENEEVSASRMPLTLGDLALDSDHMPQDKFCPKMPKSSNDPVLFPPNQVKGGGGESKASSEINISVNPLTDQFTFDAGAIKTCKDPEVPMDLKKVNISNNPFSYLFSPLIRDSVIYERPKDSRPCSILKSQDSSESSSCP